MNNKRPNILFIMTDQFRADTMGCAGSSVKTPALDSLAAEGVRFSECYTASPLCVPARISMMTGLYPHTTGVWKNANFVLAPEANLWVKAIRQSGYDTSVFGKLHLHTDYGDFTEREYLVNGYGFDTVNTSLLSESAKDMDLIINTAPSRVITKEVLSCLKKDVLIIDLASRPGGVDMDEASLLGIRVIWALGLPGKCAPVSAGRIIGSSILNLLK